MNVRIVRLQIWEDPADDAFVVLRAVGTGWTVRWRKSPQGPVLNSIHLGEIALFDDQSAAQEFAAARAHDLGLEVVHHQDA
ncbi:MAG: hypothetical protein ACYDD1_22260 [Caulobacteraceae bacterium]